MVIEQVADAIVSVMGCSRDVVVADANLIDLGIDSLKAINIVFELEEEFDIEIPNELIAEMVTVADVVASVEKLCDTAPA